jgi:hypothetical protein
MYSNLELLVTPSGHVDDQPGSRKLFQLILDGYRARKRPRGQTELLAELAGLGIRSAGPTPAVRMSDESNGAEGHRGRVQFESEPGVELGGTLYTPRSGGRKRAVLLVADKTSNASIPSTAALAERIAKAGIVVLELEVRDAPGEGARPFVGNWLTNTRANQIGRNLPAMRAHDISRGIYVLAARDDVDPATIRAAARGVKGIWLLLAAAADARLRKIWLDRTPFSLRTALETPMNTDLFDAVIPGFVLHWDLDDLVKAMGQRTVLWTDPSNWMGRPVALGTGYRYRYLLGDTTDLQDEQDNAFIRELIR